jgi:hypothetical protein
VIRWALRLGKSAAFLGTGLGKTLIELEWARAVLNAHDKPFFKDAVKLEVAR